MTDLKDKILRNIWLGYQNEMINDSDMVEIIKHIGIQLGLNSVGDYAKERDISVQGVYKSRNSKIMTIFGKKMVIDNE